MKKTLLTSAFAAASLLAICAATQSDPIIMTVNKTPVHKSEFEYLYHKNSQQQLQPQTLDQYVDMFVNYKLKVADAQNAGLDTTKEFLDEFNKYKYELADPYVKETAVIDSLVTVAYSHYDNIRHVRHIMLPLGQNNDDMAQAKARLDSLRTEILAGHIDWNTAAAKYSVDGATNLNGGDMGWLSVGYFPWPFEDMAYQTPVHSISPVVNSGYYYHIIRVDSIRPNPGEVKASHILKLTRGLTPEAAAKAKAQIDSIYTLLVGGADFADIAKRESQDPGSASRGGDLGWFKSGAMVAPFDSAAFTLANGQISAPVQTVYGYHIILCTGHRGVESLDDARKRIENQILADDRSLIINDAKVKRLTTLYGAHLDDGGLKKIRNLIAKNGGYDSIAIEQLKKSDIPVYVIGKTSTPVKNIMSQVAVTASTDIDAAMTIIKQAATFAMNQQLMRDERDDLINTNAEYRNLVNEYRDGILLFARANQKVWDRPNKDPEALETYFKQHRDKYKWDTPKYKGYVIMAANDSVLTLAKTYTDSLSLTSTTFDHTTFVKDMRSRFGRDIKVERVIAAKGDNPITDYLAFDGERPQDTKTSWRYYYAFRGRIINAPEEAADVKGLVTTDFQNALEEQWIKELRKKYPVTINRAVLKTVK